MRVQAGEEKRAGSRGSLTASRPGYVSTIPRVGRRQWLQLKTWSESSVNQRTRCEEEDGLLDIEYEMKGEVW